ncbi:hypothetical protein Q73A0000_14185 [Kaistella flava (ex Peng et al. 2021)]|uniref:Lipoprotein n=1 Tax=Kaistella flava (ex Peng et al. 2021) TaxID=2038776 RepID=A0A7M2YBG2_9FLAO|nr:hypothetical protein [Kaistella flava (ex Peng et al. 2021)]QOW11430.1 hypothetical protein Q73A0000_14185 [Kaistella flava (ex Peng et al. 2021)]
MNYIFSIFLFLMVGCSSQAGNIPSDTIDFEEVSHFSYNLTSGNYLILDTQDKIDAVYKIIHSKTQGNRLAPIPTLDAGETYLIFRPVLKNGNDVEIKEIALKNNILYINVEDFNNPQIEKSSRVTPNVLVKVLKKITPKKIIINYQNNSK